MECWRRANNNFAPDLSFKAGVRPLLGFVRNYGVASVFVMDDIGLGSPRASAPPRTGRRLNDKILQAFHHACDDGDYDVAARLLAILESTLTARTAATDTNRRKSVETLVAAHERLWHLRHPDETERP